MYNLGINLFFSSFRHTVILNKPHFKLQNIRLCCQLLVVRLESGVSLEGEGGGVLARFRETFWISYDN